MVTLRSKSYIQGCQADVNIPGGKLISKVHRRTDDVSISKHPHTVREKHNRKVSRNKKSSRKSAKSNQIKKNDAQHSQPENFSSPRTKESSGSKLDPEDFVKKETKSKLTQLKTASQKKKNNKINFSPNANNVRKSSRQKFPVLAHWRNERTRFRIAESGQLIFQGIDKGTKEDNGSVKNINMEENKQKQGENSICEISVLNISTGEEVCAELVKRFSYHELKDPCSGSEKPGYFISRTFTTDHVSCGYLCVFPFKKKPLQYLHEDDVHFVILRGKIEVQIHNTKFVAKEMMSFVVPFGNMYSLTNISKSKAVLSFVVLRFSPLGNE